MKNLAIIPARGGSKRIPKKNIKDFLGKPIIAYSIETALKSKLFCKVIVSTDDDEIAQMAKKWGAEVIVSTDDDEIAQMAKKWGAEVPFIRPKELADDYTGTSSVTKHALNWYKEHGRNYDYACTIYATAPLLQSKYLIKGFEKLQNSDATNAFSATSMPFPIQRTFKITSNGRCEMFWPENFMKRSQDLDHAYQDAGQFYWIKLGKISFCLSKIIGEYYR